jgi:hypothetical protein
LDDAIKMAISENEKRWILTLAHHAANIANFSGDPHLVKHYYQRSLSFNPENPRALLGLANATKAQGEPELAKRYAVRCYEALAKDANPSLLELLLNKWPEILSP